MTMPPDNFKISAEANSNTPDHPRHRRMLEPLISVYHDNEASTAERLTVERYLATCGECRQLLTGYSQVETRLRNFMQAIPEPRPLRPFGENGFARRQLEDPEELPRLTEPLPYRRTTRVGPRSSRSSFNPAMVGRLSGIAAALLVVVTLVGMVLLYRGGQSQDNPTVVAGAQLSATLEPTTPPPSPTFEPSATPTTAAPTVEATTAAPVEPTAEIVKPTQAAAPNNPPVATNPTKAAATPTPTSTPRPAPTVTPTTRSAVAPAANTTPPVATATPTVAPAVAATSPVLAAADTPNPSAGTTATNIVSTSPTATATETTTATATSVPSNATPTPSLETPLPITTTPPTPVTTVAPAVPNDTPKPSSPTPAVINIPGWIAYVSTQDGEIHLVSSDGSNDVALSKDSVANGERWEELVWSHDGNWVAATGQNSKTGEYAIYVYNISNRNDPRLNFVAQGIEPVWSPNDLSMAFLAGPLKTGNGLKLGKPSVINLKKRETQPPTTLDDEYQALPPQWFEEGTRLLIGQNNVVAPDGTPLQTFNLPYENGCAASSLSPFGNKLAILDNNSNSLVIYDLNKGTLDKNKPLARYNVTIPGKVGYKCGSYRLRWTPSGRSVYFYVNTGNADNTIVVSATGAGQTTLSGVYEPSFTVDGGHLVDFNPNQRGQVYAMPRDARPTLLNIIAHSKVPPVWQPRWS
jgi:hypothetical protein